MLAGPGSALARAGVGACMTCAWSPWLQSRARIWRDCLPGASTRFGIYEKGNIAPPFLRFFGDRHPHRAGGDGRHSTMAASMLSAGVGEGWRTRRRPYPSSVF